jgi:hypothetical protein
MARGPPSPARPLAPLLAPLLLALAALAGGAAALGAPFCGQTAQRGMDNAVRLRCADPADTIAAISFADFGTPSSDAAADCASWAAAPACSTAANASRFVAANCVGRRQCAIPTFDVLFDGGVDPCPGKSKWLAVVAQCAGGAGQSGGGDSCAVNGSACPLPVGWSQYNLTLSTVIEPGGDIAPGYFELNASRPFGLVSLDWSVANSIWHHDNQSESTVEATLTENCRRIKAASPGTRCFLYHNLELALQAFESNRAVMYDSTKSDWFVRVNGDGAIYNEPGGPGDQFFFDFRNEAASAWYIGAVLALVADPAVDGVFTDDYEGFPSEHDYAPLNTNTSYEAVAELQYASIATHGRLVAALAAAGKGQWQAMGAGYQGEYVGGGVPHDAAGCAAFMRPRCAPEWQLRPFMQSFDAGARNQSVASFLISRGPVAFLGSGWESGNNVRGERVPAAPFVRSPSRPSLPSRTPAQAFDEAFLYAVGEPLGPCAEAPAGVFSRPWTHGTVSLDCNTFVAVVPTA